MTRGPALSRTAAAIGASVFADLADRIEERRRAGADLIELHIGDTHRAPAPEARFARADGPAFDAALYRYGAVGGLDLLKEAFAEKLAAAAHGPAALDPGKHLLVACGATHALFCAARAVLDPGDEVLVAAPYWPLSVGVLRAAGAVPVEVPLTTRLHDDPSLDPAELLAPAVTPRTRALYVITPNNPDGHVLSASQLASLARFAESHDLWLLADEVYCDYVYEGEHGSPARLAGLSERTIAVHSLSKSHALAGARVGFAVGPAPAMALARRVATHTVFNVPVAAQRVALAALRSGAPWLEQARAAHREARDAAVQALATLEREGVRVPRPAGGSYAFLDLGPRLRQGRRTLPLKEALARAVDEGVLLAPGDAFGAEYGTWARLCFTSEPPARVIEGVERLRSALARL